MKLQPVLDEIDASFDRTVEQLITFCAQPSISAQGVGMEEMGHLVAQRFRALGAEVTTHPFADGYPVVFARFQGATSRTLLYYNHYDVQPPDPLDQWHSPPFQPTIRDGICYARGAADNKGALVSRLAALHAFLTVHGSLPLRVGCIVEGEEEIGSPHLAAFTETSHQEIARSDGLIWEGASADQAGNPVMRLGNKGTLHVELRARGPRIDAHARYGGVFPNPIWRLAWALGQVRRPDGRVMIPGFYEAVVAPTPTETELLERLAVDAAPLLRRYGLTASFPALSPREMMLELYAWPTCNISGISGGYEGTGSKTIVPAVAMVKLEFKLVPDQDPDVLLRALREHLAASGYGDLDVVLLSRGFPSKTPLDHPFAALVAATGERIYGRPLTVEPTSSGTGPRYAFTRQAPIPVVAVGGVGAGAMIHGPNENIHLDELRSHAKHMAALMHALAFGLGDMPASEEQP